MNTYRVVWFINGHTGSQEFRSYDEAIDTANGIIKVNPKCFVVIKSGRSRLFSYDNLSQEDHKN